MKVIELIELLESILAACEVVQTTNGRGWWSQYISEIPQAITELEGLQYDKNAITKIWKILGIENYEQAKGESIDELVANLEAKNERLKLELKASDNWLKRLLTSCVIFLDDGGVTKRSIEKQSMYNLQALKPIWETNP